jgi:hypothetical protein
MVYRPGGELAKPIRQIKGLRRQSMLQNGLKSRQSAAGTPKAA